VHVGPQQQEVAAVDFARALVVDVEGLQRRADRPKCAREGARVSARAAEANEAIAVTIADAVLHCVSVVEPHMREPRAGPGAWAGAQDIRLRPVTSLRCDQRRAAIAIAKLGTDHLVGL